ncbi:MAG: Asp-tRNA(Asn)/Glu-tRNA(Gln) amidotransferase subunit GatB [Ruminococcus sp.]|nr:Asp-tRNA(Asn)/Glu-tRNA(Gln) amidotransferase subunit GatB [Ruminococcus sp.]
MKYELVSGFETHIELQTKTKIFCGCTTQFGGEPNTHCCPVCIGLPGTLPVLNREVVRFAIRAGLAVHGEIAEIAKMDRKNYCYPDLSKAYQISQLYAPLIIGGYVELSNGRKIRLHHIHIEEDAGKLIHQHGDTYVDYNRGGVPLIEIVSEPDIRSIDEAKEYVEKLQQVMRYIGVSDCKMQEGSMRCDVNISVRPAGSEAFGTRTEIKNMNSINNIAKAMEYEYDRQVDLIESGGKVVQETLRYDDATGTTSSMRSKEDAHDYRYFRDPDLVTINIPRDEVEALRAEMPELPAEKFERYTDEYEIPEKDAALLTKYRRISEFFDAAIEGVKSPKTVSNFIIGQMFRRTETEDDKEKFEVGITPQMLGELVKLLDSGKIRNNLAKSTLEKMLDSGKGALEFISESDMGGVDDNALLELCQNAIAGNAKAVADFKGGKEKALKALVGNVMKNSRGKADAQAAEAKIKALILGE